ncbi:hypothetical protein PPACK8108_LOCUS15144 [Phakopsora pachyrhizi]|uniref:Splicing factor cactin central domain-containing protein n=1 Tax=Phakopsora pachyrhizi TaxID=170000 RepID=A0AAV0B643_PHAPC|nr:hypothetical protein PPACK8108_LOCUS15144 [Phakopsora pachyrhizi]
MAESPQMADWIAKEDDFQLKQAQKQAEIQVREKRAKPIDLLALNLTWGHRDFTDESAGVEVDDKAKKISLCMKKTERMRMMVKPNMNPQDQEILDQDALAEKLYAQEAEKRLAEAEEVFELEAKTGRQSYNWEDKHRPHKPCYFYNQTHYNTDNPPPKVVQGYSKHHYFYVSEPQLKEVLVILTYIYRVQHLLS